MAERTMAGSLGLNGDWDLGEDLWKDGADENWLKLSALAEPVALDLVSVTPVAPSEGDVYLFDETHATNPNAVAVYDEAAWHYFTPVEGWMCYDTVSATMRLFNGANWEEFTSGGGGGGGGGSYTPPTIVQSKIVIGNNTTVTLDSVPTAGNLLVAIGTHFNDASQPFGSGWTGVQRNAGVTTDGNFIATKVAVAGESAIQTPFGGTTAGSNTVIFEIANSNGQLVIPYAQYSESVSGVGDLKLGIPLTGCLVLGMFSTVSANTAPTAVTGATALATVQGTSTSASPRQLTPFYRNSVSKGGVTVSVTYAGTPRQNAIAVVVLPYVADAGVRTESIIVAVGDEVTAITTGVAKVTFRMPYAFTLTGVRASLTTASSSGVPTVDINEAGVSVLSTKLTIDATEKTSTTAAAAAVISDAALADDAEITIDIDVAGTGAKGLKVYLIGHQ